jgi:polar amino acid transport system substrate-binding protein
MQIDSVFRRTFQRVSISAAMALLPMVVQADQLADVQKAGELVVGNAVCALRLS